ncbi:Os02g0115650, partial [Oryza sativa Japonica Group]
MLGEFLSTIGLLVSSGDSEVCSCLLASINSLKISSNLAFLLAIRFSTSSDEASGSAFLRRNLGEGELGILAEEAPELQLHPVPLVERGQVPSSVPTGARRRSEEAHPAGPGGTSAAEQYGARSCAGAREDAGRGGGGGEGFHGRSG